VLCGYVPLARMRVNTKHATVLLRALLVVTHAEVAG
jgi:hypothetical protein